MENQKSNITVADTAIVNINFKVDSSIEQEFRNLISKGYVTLASNATDAQKAQHSKNARRESIAKMVVSLNGGLLTKEYDDCDPAVILPAGTKSKAPLVYILRGKDPDSLHKLVELLESCNTDNPSEHLFKIKLAVNPYEQRTLKDGTIKPFDNCYDRNVVIQIQEVADWLLFIEDKFGSYDKWLESMSKAKTVLEIIEPFYELVPETSKQTDTQHQVRTNARNKNKRLMKSNKVVDNNARGIFRYQEIQDDESIDELVVDAYSGMAKPNSVIGFKVSSKMKKEIEQAQKQADLDEEADLEARLKEIRSKRK